MLNNLATVGIKFKNSTQGENKVGASTVFTLNDNLEMRRLKWSSHLFLPFVSVKDCSPLTL
jgi:hypothetical protein